MKKFMLFRSLLTSTRNLSVLASLACTQVLYSQDTASCLNASSFRVVSISQKKQNKEAIEVSLAYKRANLPSNFLSYPYISAILNEKGDTLAKGNMNAYGHLPNSKQLYDLQKTAFPFVKNKTVRLVMEYIYNGERCSTIISFKIRK